MEESFYKTLKFHENSVTSGRSLGSFYDLLPNILESVQKPDKDDILRKLHENTRSDRGIEWRMRTRRYEGCKGESDGELVNSFLGDDDDEPGDGASLLQHGSSVGNWKKKVDDGFRGIERCREYVNGNVKSQFSRSTLFCGYPEEDGFEDIGRRNFIRERCRKKGGLYGPEAIAAVGGPGFTKSTILGGGGGGVQSARNPSISVLGSVYDENPGAFLWSSSPSRRFSQKKCESSTTSSITSSPRNLNGIQLKNGNKFSPRGSLQRSTLPNVPSNSISCLDKTKVPSESAITASNITTTNKKDIPPKNFFLPKKLTNLQTRNAKASGVGKVNVEIGIPFSRTNVQHGRMKMPRRTTKKKKGKSSKRKKSVSNNKNKDTRHKGPKIEGINWKNSGEVVEEEEQPKIRTVVLPFPQPRHRHLM